MIDSKGKETIFYKKRNVGQRLAAALDFLQSNGWIVFKTVFKIGIPMLLISSFFMNSIIDGAMFYGEIGDFTTTAFAIYGFAWLIFYVLASSMLNAAMACMMNLSAEGHLNRSMKLSDMKQLLSFTFNGFGILLIFIVVMAFMCIVGIYFESPWIIVTIVLIILFFIPFVSLMHYPLYFEEKGIVGSIDKGIKLGWAYWGTTALIVLITTVFSGMLGYFFTIFFYVTIAIRAVLSEAGIPFFPDLIGFIGIFFVSLPMLIITPFTFACMAFQYFGIRDDREGLSIRMKIEEFENL